MSFNSVVYSEFKVRNKKVPHCKCMEPFTVVICRISCRTLSSWRRLLCASYWRRPFTNFPNTTSVPSAGWAFVCLSFSLHQQHVSRCSFCTAVWAEMYCQHPTDCRTNTQLTDNMLHININVLFLYLCVCPSMCGVLFRSCLWQCFSTTDVLLLQR